LKLPKLNWAEPRNAINQLLNRVSLLRMEPLIDLFAMETLKFEYTLVPWNIPCAFLSCEEVLEGE
jgi:hypothetical protein